MQNNFTLTVISKKKDPHKDHPSEKKKLFTPVKYPTLSLNVPTHPNFSKGNTLNNERPL